MINSPANLWGISGDSQSKKESGSGIELGSFAQEPRRRIHTTTTILPPNGQGRSDPRHCATLVGPLGDPTDGCIARYCPMARAYGSVVRMEGRCVAEGGGPVYRRELCALTGGGRTRAHSAHVRAGASPLKGGRGAGVGRLAGLRVERGLWHSWWRSGTCVLHLW